jgi:hypothetical protein
MRRSALALGLSAGLLVMSRPCTAQTTLVVLSPANGFQDEIEPGVIVRRDPVDEVGPLVGQNLEFACGSCDTATFPLPPVTRIGSFGRPCGPTIRPQEIVTMDLLLCARSTLTSRLYDMDLLTWNSQSFSCIDADGGTSCNSAGGYASYVRTALTPVALLQQVIRNLLELQLESGTETSLQAKLDAAIKKLSDANPNNDVAAIDQLHAFVNQVEALSGHKISEEDADDLISAAQQVIAWLENA